jgi:putative ABC transport system permease protein
VLGLACAGAIMMMARFQDSSINTMVQLQFRLSQQQDLSASFIEASPHRAVNELRALPGVRLVEGFRSVPVRFRVGHRWRDSVLIGHPKHARLQRVIEWPLREVAMPNEGLVLTRKLASILDVGVGDEVEVDILEGQRRQRRLVIVRLTEEMAGLQGHVELAYLNRLVGDDDTVSAALLSVDTGLLSAVEHALKRMPLVASVERRDNVIAQFIKQSEQTTLATTTILTAFGAIIAIGVVYNNARVVLSMRSRELASLRVLGFTRGEISAMLLGELAVQVALGLPLGLVIGTWMARGIAATVDPEAFRFPVVISTRTYAFATFVTMVAAVASAFIVRAKLDRLDLIAVLKEGQ